MHRIDHTVHLQGVRCDGQAHGGCQAACLVYWKEAWLRRADGHGEVETPAPVPPAAAGHRPAAAHGGDPHARRGGATGEEVFSRAKRPSCCGRRRPGSRPGISASFFRGNRLAEVHYRIFSSALMDAAIFFVVYLPLSFVASLYADWSTGYVV